MQRTIDRPGETGRPSDMVEAVRRLRDEHSDLRQTIERIEAAAARADRMAAVSAAANEISGVKQPLVAFMHALERHAAWEEENLIPLIEEHMPRSHESAVRDSIWVMEKDHQMATVYLRVFLERLNEFGDRPNAGVVADAVRCLLQGCVLLKEHFRIEEQTIFQAVEQLVGETGL